MNRKQSFFLLSAVAVGTALYNIFKPIRTHVPVVEDFDKEKYLGQWYEIARLDFFWEKNLKNVTANYSLNEDGTIQVINRGFHTKQMKEKESRGKARFVTDNEKEGALKVSFFGPFYSGYNVVQIDKNYQHALVFGDNTDYMWILSREKTLPEDVKREYLDYARLCGYDVSKLVWTIQD